MSRVLVLVEGQTERIVVDQFLNPHFNAIGVYLYPRIVGKPGHKGGVRSFDATCNELLMLLKSDRSCAAVTMLFDYYALPADWPGVPLAREQNREPAAMARIVENAVGQEVEARLHSSGCQTRFIPYIQMHELEALLFSGPADMAGVFGVPQLAASFDAIVTECGGCEKIDDGPATAPSKRIASLFPGYRKGGTPQAHAPRVLGQIGLETVRRKCLHFDEWCKTLEGLEPSV